MFTIQTKYKVFILFKIIATFGATLENVDLQPGEIIIQIARETDNLL